MRVQTYIGNKTCLDIAQEALELRHKPKLREQLCASIKNVRGYVIGKQQGAYEFLHDLPCGHQDAFYDNVCRMYEHHAALMAAYELRFLGKATRLQKLLDDALEREEVSA